MTTSGKKPPRPEAPLDPTPAPKVPLLRRGAALGSAVTLGLTLGVGCGDDTVAPMVPPEDSSIAPMPPPIDSGAGDATMDSALDTGVSDAAADSTMDDAATDGGGADTFPPPPMPPPADGG
jgi:hypothetical protein